jgi:hypothetical protein
MHRSFDEHFGNNPAYWRQDTEADRRPHGAAYGIDA